MTDRVADMSQHRAAEASRVTPVIDRSYPSSEVPEVIRYLEEMDAMGKVVITSCLS